MEIFLGTKQGHRWNGPGESGAGAGKYGRMGELCAFARRVLPFLVKIRVGKYCCYFSCISSAGAMDLQAIMIVWT